MIKQYQRGKSCSQQILECETSLRKSIDTLRNVSNSDHKPGVDDFMRSYDLDATIKELLDAGSELIDAVSEYRLRLFWKEE